MESAPNAALVHTLAIGKDGRAADAYGEESRFIADRMAEAESVSARKATLLDPTGEDETIQVLRRMPPCAGYVARTILMHTFAFNDPLKGLSPEQLRYSVLGPAVDVSFVEEARRKFIAESACLDDRPGALMRFLAEANLGQIVRRAERHVDAGEVRAHLNDRIREIFGGGVFEMAAFPGGPFDVPDEVGDGRPKLVVSSCDAVAIGAAVESVPELVERIYARKGSEGSALRALRNHLVFVVADDARTADMRGRTRRRLALGS